MQAHESVQVKTHLDPQVGIAVISTDEPGALVEIDGKASGFTPAILTLPAGPHQVRLSLKGFRTQEWHINISADGENQTRLYSVLSSRTRSSQPRAPSSKS